MQATSHVRQAFDAFLVPLLGAVEEAYGDRLVSLAVFGSVARGTPRWDSDVDLLIVAAPLPDGRMPRVREFDAVEAACEPALRGLRATGIETRLSPVFKTPSELASGSMLLLDMTDQVRILSDRNGVLRDRLDRLRERLQALGARRVQRAGGYYWKLKPDFRPGDRIEL